MKSIILLAFCLITFWVNGQNNKGAVQDSLTWYVYIPGKPYMRGLNAQKKVVADLGIKTNYFFGDCGGTYDYRIKEFDKKNQKVYNYLSQRFGKEWEQEIQLKVDSLLKLSQKK